METDVAKHDRAWRNRGCRPCVGRIESGEIAFESSKFRVRRDGGGELLQHLTHLHRRPRDSGKDEKHAQDDRRVNVEQHQADKGNQRADQSGYDRSGKAVTILLTECSRLSPSRLS